MPKKQEAYFFTSRLSLGRMSRRGSIFTASVPARSQRALHLDGPKPGVLQIVIVVDHGREDHRDAALMRDIDHRLLRLDLAVEIGAQRHR